MILANVLGSKNLNLAAFEAFYFPPVASKAKGEHILNINLLLNTNHLLKTAPNAYQRLLSRVVIFPP